MNSKERMKLAFAHHEPDRVPVGEIEINEPIATKILGRPAWMGFGGSHRGKRANEMALAGRMDEYFAREAEDRVELTRKLELDFITLYPHGKIYGKPEVLEENVWRFSDPASGNWSIYRYQPESDVYSEVDSSQAHQGIEGLEKQVENMEKTTTPDTSGLDFTHMDWIIDRLGKNTFIVGNVDIYFGLYAAAGTIMLEAVALRPELLERYLDAQMPHILAFLEAQAAHGVDAVMGGEDWAGSNGPLISPRSFRRLILPRLKILVNRCHELGIPFIKHTDGNIYRIEQELLVDSGIDGYHAIEPSAGMDIADLKKRHGTHLTLLGNVDCGYTLCNGTKQQVVDETLHVIRSAAPGGGFVLTSSNSLHQGVKLENYMTLLETARQYGSYPIRHS
jgi:hypothetical protein